MLSFLFSHSNCRCRFIDLIELSITTMLCVKVYMSNPFVGNRKLCVIFFIHCRSTHDRAFEWVCMCVCRHFFSFYRLMLGGCYCLIICLWERENASTSGMGRESKRKNGEEWDSFHMMNNERRRHSLFFIPLLLSTYIYVARSSIAFCITSLPAYIDMHGAGVGECKKHEVQINEGKIIVFHA